MSLTITELQELQRHIEQFDEAGLLSDRTYAEITKVINNQIYDLTDENQS